MIASFLVVRFPYFGKIFFWMLCGSLNNSDVMLWKHVDFLEYFACMLQLWVATVFWKLCAKHSLPPFLSLPPSLPPSPPSLPLSLSLSLSAGVEGQGRVVWQYGMFGVSEGDESVTVCANYSDAVEGFTVETSTTEVFAREYNNS